MFIIRTHKLNFNYFSLIAYFEQYVEYDPFFIQPELTNPWISDNCEMWEQEKLAYVSFSFYCPVMFFIFLK